MVEYGAGRVFAIEVETTSAPGRDDARHLAWLLDAIGDRFIGGAVPQTCGAGTFELGDKIVAAPIACLWTHIGMASP